MPIAVFDSGVGGMTVLKALRHILPGEDLIYLGDTARVPYGIKSPDTIARYTLRAAEALMAKGAKMLVIACNTATSAALPIVSRTFSDIPVLGVIGPGARAAVEATRNGRIAVIGTEATIKGGAYQKAIGELAPQAFVTGRACTLFVSLAEEGWLKGGVAEETARIYLGDIFAENSPNRPDTLLLGCTHFPLLLEPLSKAAGKDTRIVDSATATAKAALEELQRLDLLSERKNAGTILFFTTDNPERFAHTGTLFLDSPIKASQVELMDL